MGDEDEQVGGENSLLVPFTYLCCGAGSKQPLLSSGLLRLLAGC